jgi:hypothetical protein
MAAAYSEFAKPLIPRKSWIMRAARAALTQGGTLPKYLINEGLETEEVIVAARATEGNIQWWFYDTGNRAQEIRLKGQVQTIREVTHL